MLLRNFPLFLVMSLLLIGCANKGILEREERRVENILRRWQDQTVEDILGEYPEVNKSLDLGGDKVRYTYLYEPPNNFEWYFVMSRYRYYRLYFFIQPTGEIYKTNYRRVYLREEWNTTMIGYAVAITLAGVAWLIVEAAEAEIL